MGKALRYICSEDYGKFKKQMIELHRSGGGDISEGLYDSLYQGNPYGPPLLGLCFDGERLVGQENYIRHDVGFQGKVYKASLGLNTFVDPGYRLFHGVFGKLCELTIEGLRDSSDFLIAFANEESKKYYLKYFQWHISSKVRVYKKAVKAKGLKPESLLSLMRPGKKGKELQLRPTEHFDPRILDPILEDHLHRTDYFFVYKTCAFLNWKFLRNRHYQAKGFYIETKGECCGYIVTCDFGIERRVLDFVIAGNDITLFEKVLSTLSALTRKEGRARLVVHATPGCWYEKALKKYFFLLRWDYDFITRNLSDNLPEGKWLIQIGDFDIF